MTCRSCSPASASPSPPVRVSGCLLPPLSSRVCQHVPVPVPIPGCERAPGCECERVCVCVRAPVPPLSHTGLLWGRASIISSWPLRDVCAKGWGREQLGCRGGIWCCAAPSCLALGRSAGTPFPWGPGGCLPPSRAAQHRWRSSQRYGRGWGGGKDACCLQPQGYLGSHG